MKSRVFLTAAVAGLVCAHAIGTSQAAEPASQWVKVPPLPTACYTENDAAYEKLAAAHESVQQDHGRQNDANSEVEQQARNTDMMEVASRMQEEMMRDPEAAAKLIESMSNPQAVAEAQSEAKEQSEEENQFRREETDALKVRYEAALKKAYGPANARRDALIKKLDLSPEASLRFPFEFGPPDSAFAERDEILRMWDKAYQATCPAWFGAGGQIQAHLKGYKDYLIQKRIPMREENEMKKVAVYEAHGLPAGFKPVAT